jgi:hypothetical protein
LLRQIVSSTSSVQNVRCLEEHRIQSNRLTHYWEESQGSGDGARARGDGDVPNTALQDNESKAERFRGLVSFKVLKLTNEEIGCGGRI